MSSQVKIRIPRFLKWRSYQAPLWNAMVHDGCKRAVVVWHRRAGKDLTALNVMIAKMFQRPGTYYYFFPSYAQAKKVIWDGQDKHGRPFLSHFPPECIDGRWEDELKLRLRLPDGNFSTFQLIGVDKLGSEKAGDSIVGTNAVGLVFSEYSLMNERAWNLMRPVLRENDGWAIFVFTPRGKNHGYKLYKTAMANRDRWFCTLRTVEDTCRDAEGEDGRAVVTKEGIQEDIDEGMDPALVRQEYYCSFEGAIQGSYYADLILRAREEGRIRPRLFDPRLAVDTAWDLGVDDATAIGFTQTAGNVLRFIDYYEGAGFGLAHYAGILRSRAGKYWSERDAKMVEAMYRYNVHYGPHDLKVKEWGTGNTRFQRAASEGIHFEIVPKLHIADGIEAVRRMLATAEFDEETCSAPEMSEMSEISGMSAQSAQPGEAPVRRHGLIDALMTYRREWDEKLATWRSTPVHDWSSHPADMVRYRAIAHFELGKDPHREQYDGDWAVFEKSRPESYDQWDAYGDS